MRPLPVVLAGVLAALVAGCGGGSGQTDHASEWQQVLHRKKAAVAPNASTQAKQVYADSVAAFVHKNPSHGRAREVYHRMQLEFGEDLAALGRYQDAIRFYRAVLLADPANLRAQHDVSVALDRLAVSRAKLLALEKGMSQRRVAQILGKPIPGWTKKNERRDVEAWYYRKTDGGVAGVYFRDGELFAAEENSHAKLAPLVR
jgi:tetratricopeptide (TPR) repeat protein